MQDFSSYWTIEFNKNLENIRLELYNHVDKLISKMKTDYGNFLKELSNK